nr:XRE family transcriptional regulator [Melghirimyces profundicolus]
MDRIYSEIKRIRLQKQITLKHLSERTGLSVSFLSQVERGSSSLAITSLKKISDGLGVHISHFFQDSGNQRYTVKKEDYQPFRIEGSIAEYVRLSGEFAERRLEPMLVTLDPLQVQETVFSHPGEEFFFVLEGEVKVYVEGEEYLLKKGEAIHYPSRLQHYWMNPLNQRAQILCVLTPVIF